MHYIEYAIGSTANRGHIVSLEQFVDILMEYGPKEDVFRSVYLYDDSIVSHVNNGGRIKDFYGPRYIDTIPIDIDKGDDTHENVRRRAASICGKLVNDGLDEFNFYVCYSGTGYHIHIAPEVFGFYPNVGDKELPYKIKSTIQSYFGGEADSAIYTY